MKARTEAEVFRAVITAIGTEDKIIKSSCYDIRDAIGIKRRKSAEADLEGQMMTLEQANLELQRFIYEETGVSISTATLDKRRLTADWLDASDRTFIPGVEFGKHDRCRSNPTGTWKKLKANPRDYEDNRVGKRSGKGVMYSDEVKMLAEFQGCITSLSTIKDREIRDAHLADESDDPALEQKHLVTAREIDLALPHLQRALDERSG